MYLLAVVMLVRHFDCLVSSPQRYLGNIPPNRLRLKGCRYRFSLLLQGFTESFGTEFENFESIRNEEDEYKSRQRGELIVYARFVWRQTTFVRHVC